MKLLGYYFSDIQSLKNEDELYSTKIEIRISAYYR